MAKSNTQDIVVNLGDGQFHTYENVPNNIGQTEILSRISNDFPGKQAKIEQIVQAPKKTAYEGFLEGLSNPPEIKGRSPIAGAALAGLGGETLKNIGAATQLVAPSVGTPMVETGQAMTEGSAKQSPVSTVAGQIGSYLLPTNVLSKGANLIAQGSKTLPSLMAQGAGVSGTLGFLTTPGTVGERMGGTAIDTLMGVGSPVIGKAVGAAKSLVEPLYEKGREQILGRFLRETAGADSDKAIANMLGAKEVVPGSQPTVGQVSGVPSLASLERSAMATGTPEAINTIAARKAAQNQARVEALEGIATPTRVSKYDALRERVGNDLYEPALSQKMVFEDLTPELQKEVQGLIKSPSIKQAMNQAKANAADRGVNISDPSGSLRGLHETKMALDDQIAKLKAIDPTGAQKARLDALVSAKGRLLDFIETVSPDYKQARETFARLSKPIEQLQTIENLGKKAISADKDKVHINAFFNELNKVKEQGNLSKQQMARLDAIAEDLRRTKFSENAGRGVGSDTAQKLTYSNMLSQLGVPNAVRNMPAGQVLGSIASRVGQPIYGGAEQQMKTRLAELLMNPQEAARVMQNARLNQNVGSPTAETLAKILMMPEYFKENK